MRTIILGVMVGLTFSRLAGAEGYYPPGEGPGSINWPPPGGASLAPAPTMPAWNVPMNQGFRPYPDYQQTQRYHNPYPRQFRQELITPPDAAWPNADYYQGGPKTGPDQQSGELRPEPMKRGEPVEVIPPPSVPVGEVTAPISDRPARGWRPMKEHKELEAMEESVERPVPEEKKPLVMREIEKPSSPLQAPEEKNQEQAETDETVKEQEDSVSTQFSPPPQVQQTHPFVSGMSIVPDQKNSLPMAPPSASGPEK